MASQVADNPELERYEIHLDGALAGFATYKRRPGLIAFIHTEIASGFEGQGLASALIQFALDDARDRGEEVLPFCPFVRGFIEQHGGYVELVPADQRDRFALEEVS